MEQRRHPRYQLVTPLAGIVEQGGGRYAGSVLNISVGGFYLHLPKSPAESLKIHGLDDYGEIHYAGRNAYGFGAIARIEKFPSSVGIGFSWDKSGMDAKSSQIIEEQERRKSLGWVVTSGHTIKLSGYVSSALSHDVFSAVQSIGAGNAVISLSGVASIDSSGIELLMALRDRGVALTDASTQIDLVLKRFQLSQTRKEDRAG